MDLLKELDVEIESFHSSSEYEKDYSSIAESEDIYSSSSEDDGNSSLNQTKKINLTDENLAFYSWQCITL